MATWEDGPEYAPHEPPAHFTAPAAEPLSHAEARPRPSAQAPTQPPSQFTAPAAAPLAAIGATLGASHRNPQQPFDVRTGALTQGTSAWSAAHSMQNADPAAQQWAPPTGPPVVATTPAAGSERDPRRPIDIAGSTPAPATSPWAPPPPGAVPVAPNPQADTTAPTWRRVLDLLTWPLAASLVLGFIPPISPVMLIVSTVLAWRLNHALRSVRIAITAGLGYTVLIALLALLGNSWWSTTSTWAVAVTVFAALYAVVMAFLVVSGKVRPPAAPPSSP